MRKGKMIMSDNQKKDMKAEFKEKQDNLLSDLGLIETGMSENLQVDEADVIECTIKHINMLSTDLEKCAQFNEGLAVTNKALMGELNNKAKNLLSFHTANILQGLINSGSLNANSSGTHLINRSVELSKKLIERITEEAKTDNKDKG